MDGRLVAELERIVGPEWIYTAEHQLRTYESDGLLQYAATPAAAVLPNSSEQVRDVVRACARAGVPWVARGAKPSEKDKVVQHINICTERREIP